MGLKFIRLARRDEKCRCCGRGREYICPDCSTLFRRGYAFMIEVKDNVEKRKRPTGYNIAFKAKQVFDPFTGQPYKPGIYFVRESDLKEFLGDDYNNFRKHKAPDPASIKGELINDITRIAPRRPKQGLQPTTELVHE